MKKRMTKTQVSTLAFSLFSIALSSCGTPADGPVSLCCEIDGAYSYQLDADCKKLGGTPASLNQCNMKPDVSLCCEIDGAFSYQLSSECKSQGGSPAALDRCNTPDLSICCEKDGAFSTEIASECKSSGGTQVALEKCCVHEVCCKTSQGYETVEDCPEGQEVSADLCEPEPELICCQLEDGSYTETITEKCKEPLMVVAAEFCEEPELICCQLEDGSYTETIAEKCKQPLMVVAADLCEPEPELICCQLEDGSYTETIAEKCKEPLMVVAAEFCEEPELICCQLEDGSYTETIAEKCKQPLMVVADDLCKVDELTCCRIQGEFVVVPESQCPAAQLAQPNMCKVCCEKSEGNYFSTDFSICAEPLVVVDDALCNPEAKKCVQYQAIDMDPASLPYTTTGGITLTAVTPTAPYSFYPFNPSSSMPCFAPPTSPIKRTNVGYVGGTYFDAVLTFSGPVSELFILRGSANATGDTLNILQPSTIIPTGCGAGLMWIDKVELSPASNTVSVRDISSDGGSGYSVLLAECVKWQ